MREVRVEGSLADGRSPTRARSTFRRVERRIRCSNESLLSAQRYAVSTFDNWAGTSMAGLKPGCGIPCRERFWASRNDYRSFAQGARVGGIAVGVDREAQGARVLASTPADAVDGDGRVVEAHGAAVLAMPAFRGPLVPFIDVMVVAVGFDGWLATCLVMLTGFASGSCSQLYKLPNGKCCTTGNLETTSALYIFSMPYSNVSGFFFSSILSTLPC